MKHFIVMLLTSVALAQAPPVVNNGFGLPPNGPCTPAVSDFGICVDQQTQTTPPILVWYDNHGNKSPFGGAPLASPNFTGNPTAPTPALGNNTTSIATMAAIQQAIASIPQTGGVKVGTVLTGTLTCTGEAGKSIPSGFSTSCTFTITGMK